MRWIVIGAGGVGGTIGGMLARAGQDVVLVARGEHGRRIREHGLRLATPSFDESIRVPVASGPQDVELEPDDVLLLAVKSQHTQRALDEWQTALVGGSALACHSLPVICAQNGIANEPEALRRFDTVVGMYVWLPATYVEPGVVEAQGDPEPGLLVVGAYPPGFRRDPEYFPPPGALPVELSGQLRDAGFRSAVVPDVMAWKASKLLGNLANAVEAARGPVVDGGDTGTLADLAAREGERVLAAAGIDVADPAELAAALDGLGAREVNGRPRSGGSTWQSLARGAGSVEVDYLNGEIVQLARRHGLEAPVNRRLQLEVLRMLALGKRPREGGQRL